MGIPLKVLILYNWILIRMLVGKIIKSETAKYAIVGEKIAGESVVGN